MNIHEYQGKALLRSYGIPVSDGRVVMSGSSESIRSDETVRRSYLGA